MQFLGEEVDTEEAILASLRRHADADDLARAALEDDKITNADEVAWDCDGVGSVVASAWCYVANLLLLTISDTTGTGDLDVNLGSAIIVVVVMVVSTGEGMGECDQQRAQGRGGSCGIGHHRRSNPCLSCCRL